MWRCALAGLAASAMTLAAAGQEVPVIPYLTPPETETLKAELKETTARLQAFEAENETLRRQHELTKQSLATLTQTLAEANAEAELFRRQYTDLKQRMEALGLASVGDNKEALEQRLLKSVRDLALLQQEKKELAEHFTALAEAIFRYLKTDTGSGDPAARMDVETQVRAASKSLGTTDPADPAKSAEPDPSLLEGQVISVKSEWSLVVANLGSKQGVRLGMPFKVVRGDKLIAEVRAIDVRENITGTVLEGVGSENLEVKVGDKLRIDTQF